MSSSEQESRPFGPSSAKEDLAKAIAEFAAREQYNATEPFTGLPPSYVVGVIDLIDELCRLMPELDTQIKDWFNAAVDAAEAAEKRS